MGFTHFIPYELLPAAGGARLSEKNKKSKGLVLRTRVPSAYHALVGHIQERTDATHLTLASGNRETLDMTVESIV